MLRLTYSAFKELLYSQAIIVSHIHILKIDKLQNIH